MLGFQNLKNDPRHWNIDADEGVPFSVDQIKEGQLLTLIMFHKVTKPL